MKRYGVRPEKLLEFFQGGTMLTYEKSQVIIRPEDEPSGIFLIKEGFVKTYAITKYGDENLLIIRKKDEMFPLIWAIQDEHREVYYEAMSDVVLYRVTKRDFLSMMENDLQIMHYMLDQVVEMYRIHSERLYNLQFKSTSERVAYHLLTLAKRYGEGYSLGPGRVVIAIPIRHSDIAASLGTTRETVSRIMKKLEKKRIISYEKPFIVLEDIDNVRKIVY